jgi:glycosyltransferase involved in cell wall biosynthesis
MPKINKKTMKIGINASFLRKQGSGTEQVTRGFLTKLLEFSKNPQQLDSSELRAKLENSKFYLYAEEDFDLELPTNFKKRIFLPGFYQRDDLIRKTIWEKFLLPGRVKGDGCQAFFSLYQSPTVLGTSHLMLVHDVTWKLFPEYLSNIRKKIYQWMVDQAIPRADKLLTVSQYSKKLIEEYFPQKKAAIAVALIDCDPVFKQSKSPSQEDLDVKILGDYDLSLEKRNYILYIGGFDSRKNVPGLIEAYGRLVNSLKKQGEKTGNIPDLVLVGKFHPHLVPLVTDLPSCIEEVSDKYDFPKDKIKMPGFVATEEVPSFFRQALFACYPSFYEGFGIPPLEAMACGCPVITSNTSSLPEVVGESALLVNPENKQELAEAMEKLTQSATMRADLARQGQNRADEFSWGSFTEKTLVKLFDLVEDERKNRG